MVQEPPRPFISYAREDQTHADRVREWLVDVGVDPWIDHIKLQPGQNWDLALRSAMRKATHVILLLSRHSINKRGYVQREMRIALELLEELPPDKLFVIPVRLDETEPRHDKLRQLHWLDLFGDEKSALKQLAAAIGIQQMGTGPPKPSSLLERIHLVTSNESGSRVVVLPSRSRIFEVVGELLTAADSNAHIRAAGPLLNIKDHPDHHLRSHLELVADRCAEAARTGGRFAHHTVFGFKRSKSGLIPRYVRDALLFRVNLFARRDATTHVRMFELSDEWTLNVLFVDREQAVIAFPESAWEPRIQFGFLITGTDAVGPLVDWFDSYIQARAIPLAPDRISAVRHQRWRTA
jgi:hypothetical protein